MPLALARAPMVGAGPTRIGGISPSAAASVAPSSAVSSHGYATAVGAGDIPRHRSSTRSYFPLPGCVMDPAPAKPAGPPAHGGGRGLFVVLVSRRGGGGVVRRPPLGGATVHGFPAGVLAFLLLVPGRVSPRLSSRSRIIPVPAAILTSLHALRLGEAPGRQAD